MSVRIRIAVIAVAWLLVAPIAILVPSAPAQATESPTFASWLAESSSLDRVSAGSVGGFAAAAEIDCDSIVWQGSPACTGPDPAPPVVGPPAPDPCILYANTPACPNPPDDGDDEDDEEEPDPLVIEAEARGKAEALLEDALKNPGWGMDPSPDDDHLQIVGLDSYMYTDISWNTTVEREADAGPDGHVISVTVSAEPQRTLWTFTELGPQGRPPAELPCDSGGNKWNDTNPAPLCPKAWDHSSAVTGDVRVELSVEYDVTWTSTHEGRSGSLGLWPVDSDTEKTVTVAEVLTFGWSPKNNEDDGGGCGGFWGWACKVAKIALDLALDAVYLLAPWVEPIVDFFVGCGDAVIDKLGGLVNLANEAISAISNPGAFLDEKVGLLTEMFAAAKADPEGFLLEMVGSIAELEYLDENGKAAYVGKMLCGFAIEYLSGAAFASIAQKLERFLGRHRDRDGNLCRVSSFPGDTLVLMADGTHRRIDTIRPGDLVLSHNLLTSTWEAKLVVDQWSYVDQGSAATLTLTDSSDITATDDHKFWVENTNSWTELQWLKAGDEVLTPSGSRSVDEVSVGPRHDWRVWELTVEDNHNFTVLAGGNAVLVHNNDGEDWTPEAPGDSENYFNPGTHDPNGGDNPYDPSKSLLPDDHGDLWDRSVPDPDNPRVRWAIVGEGKNAVYHRFSGDHNGNWHWNGSTDGVTLSGKSRAIEKRHVPRIVKNFAKPCN